MPSPLLIRRSGSSSTRESNKAVAPGKRKRERGPSRIIPTTETRRRRMVSIDIVDQIYVNFVNHYHHA
jgi:hypothetical protein